MIVTRSRCPGRKSVARMLSQRIFLVTGRTLARRAFHNLPSRELKQLEELLAVQKPAATRGAKGVYTNAARILRIEQHLDLASPCQTLRTLAAAGLPKSMPIKEQSEVELCFPFRNFFDFDDWMISVSPFNGIRCMVNRGTCLDLCNLVGGYFEFSRTLEIHEAKDWMLDEGWAAGEYKRLSPRNPLWEGEEDSEYEYACDDGLDLEDLNVLPPEDGPMYLSDGVWLHSGGHLSNCPHDPHKH